MQRVNPAKILLYPSRTHHPHIQLFQVCLIGLGFSGPRQLRLAGAYLFRNLLVKISQVESSWRSAKQCYQDCFWLSSSRKSARRSLIVKPQAPVANFSLLEK